MLSQFIVQWALWLIFSKSSLMLYNSKKRQACRVLTSGILWALMTTKNEGKDSEGLGPGIFQSACKECWLTNRAWLHFKSIQDTKLQETFSKIWKMDAEGWILPIGLLNEQFLFLWLYFKYLNFSWEPKFSVFQNNDATVY